jgi:hypothetical protein
MIRVIKAIGDIVVARRIQLKVKTKSEASKVDTLSRRRVQTLGRGIMSL